MAVPTWQWLGDVEPPTSQEATTSSSVKIVYSKEPEEAPAPEPCSMPIPAAISGSASEEPEVAHAKSETTTAGSLSGAASSSEHEEGPSRHRAPLESTRCWPQACRRTEWGGLEVHLSNWNLDDEAVQEWCRWAQDSLPLIATRAGRDGKSPVLTVDLSFNRIGDKGVEALVSLFIKLPLKLQVLKLHRNLLGCASAMSLGHMLRTFGAAGDRCGMLEELHLSHNNMQLDGILELLQCVALAGEGTGQPAYPCKIHPAGLMPLWLRIEHNRLPTMTPEEFINHVTGHLERIRRSNGWLHSRVDMLCLGDRRLGCRSRCCGKQMGIQGPIAHVFGWDRSTNEFLKPRHPSRGSSCRLSAARTTGTEIPVHSTPTGSLPAASSRDDYKVNPIRQAPSDNPERETIEQVLRLYLQNRARQMDTQNRSIAGNDPCTSSWMCANGVTFNKVVVSGESVFRTFMKRHPTRLERSWDGLKNLCQFYHSLGIEVYVVLSEAITTRHLLPVDLQSVIVMAPQSENWKYWSDLLMMRLAMVLDCPVLDNTPRYPFLDPDVWQWFRPRAKQIKLGFDFTPDGAFLAASSGGSQPDMYI